MKILISGSEGFIGINLVKNLVCNDANINKILKDDSGEDYEFVEVKNDFLDDSDSD